jgi:predicted O-methyltransferase YrrM
MMVRASRPGLDPFRAIHEQTERHRAQHGCWAYPFRDGPALGVLAMATDARRIVECGTALGYTACWFAHGSPLAEIHTIERDPEHVAIARTNIASAGFAERVRVIQDDFSTALASLGPGYDIAFFDGYAPQLDVFVLLTKLLRKGGLLISANLDLADGDAVPVCGDLLDPAVWMTSFMIEAGRSAVSVKR